MRLRGVKARGAGAEVAVGDIEQGQPPLHADGIGQHPQPPQLRLTQRLRSPPYYSVMTY